MPKIYARQVKKGKFKMLLFFLFIAFFIWLLTKFSNEFTATVEASIQYKNLPNNTVIATNNINNISFDLTSNGFDFLSYKLNKPVISIDATSFYNKENQMVSVSNIDLVKIITSELKNNIAVKNLSVYEINVMLDIISSKRIPIKAVSDISFQNGFKAIDKLKLIPDSINVSGPSIIIDTIKQVFTKQIQLNALNSNTSGEIEIDTSNNLNFSYSEKMISFSIIVEEFTQKNLSIPVTIENLPKGINVKLIPDVISITFDVSVDKFNAISENDFTIQCDYEKRNIEENFMIPEIVKKPFIIQNILIQDDKINYLIFK